MVCVSLVLLIYHDRVSLIHDKCSFIRFFIVVKLAFLHPVAPDTGNRRRRIISLYSFDVLDYRNPEHWKSVLYCYRHLDFKKLNSRI